jgi:enoyl-CoA hydratase
MTFVRRDDGPLVVLTLDHGDLNLFDSEVFESLSEQVDGLAADPPRGVLFTSAGRVVSAGVDVHEFEHLTPESAGRLWRNLLATIHRLEDLPCPTVFAARGLCLTAAFEVALACDLLIAAETARFGLVEVVVGLTPSMGGPQRLTERAGPARAKQLIYTGELFDARTLERWNVVNVVVPDAEIDERALEIARRISAGPTLAHAATKSIVRAAVERGTRAADALVPEVSGALFATADLRNAVRSFLDNGPGEASYEGQ